jgi:hypothetical protein
MEIVCVLDVLGYKEKMHELNMILIMKTLGKIIIDNEEFQHHAAGQVLLI